MVVLRLRGRAHLGATGLIVFGAYAKRLSSAGGHLYLSGVDRKLVEVLRDTPRINAALVTIVPASEMLLHSTRRAYEEANNWLADHEARQSSVTRAARP